MVLTIFNGLVMFAILALGAKGIWRNPDDPLDDLYPFFAIGCGWLIVSFVFSIRLWLRHENDKAIMASVRMIPVTIVVLMGIAAAYAVIGGTIVVSASYFGFEIPCAFRWPRCAL